MPQFATSVKPQPTPLSTQMTYYMGIGLLALPFSIHTSGWMGMLTLAASCAFAWLTANLVCKALEHSGLHKPNYADLLQISLGPVGRPLARVLLVANLFGMICVLMTMVWTQIEVGVGRVGWGGVGWRVGWRVGWYGVAVGLKWGAVKAHGWLVSFRVVLYSTFVGLQHATSSLVLARYQAGLARFLHVCMTLPSGWAIADVVVPIVVGSEAPPAFGSSKRTPESTITRCRAPTKGERCKAPAWLQNSRHQVQSLLWQGKATSSLAWPETYACATLHSVPPF